MESSESDDVSLQEKLEALIDVARFNPVFTTAIIGIGLIAALLEGIGLSFILPIIEVVQSDGSIGQSDGVMAIFMEIYQTLGVPFTLGYVIVGVASVMTARYTSSFLVDWFREALRTYYIRDLQVRAFENALNARVEYFDEEGSDDILNAIVTQTYYAGRVIRRIVQLIENVFLSLVYLLIALLFAPYLAVFALVVLGGLTVLLRHVIDAGYKTGDIVAEANEDRQETAQSGTQGIRDVRIFGITGELYDDFVDAVNRYTDARITLRRNEAALARFYNLGVSIFVFVLVFLALRVADLSFGSMGVFLFAMFRLGPRVSNANKMFYQMENDLPHLVRTQQFIRELKQRKEPNTSSKEVPGEVEHVEFDDVWFSYGDEEQVLRGINFEFRKGDFIAFAGQSGAGKSTIVSLLSRMYKVNRGEITANEVPIDDFDIDEWRDKLAVVRQNPFIFNDTLRYNLTIGNRDVSESELARVCEISKVDVFLNELPNGYDTVLGDEGVRLSGGQKQRVALARALIKDADLLILDEATSDLDSNLEKQVQDSIERMDHDYAIVAVAHRLSTIKNADRIFIMEDGRIIESGSHDDLMGSEGKYNELYEIQR